MSDIDVAVAEPYFQDAIAAWPDALRAKIVQVLWNKYSKLLDIRIKHERDDFLLGDAVDIRDAFKHPAANKKNPEILSEAGFWVPCFRKNRWLRGGATPDPCGMGPPTRNRRVWWLRGLASTDSCN
ncbi:hypothetical protein [Bradyrhizobium sp. 191]|uniref:hypothetical protein n=1 Tax=Bradyrhizobium sp. 191 TaxID=2782659 RepID=UPI001FFED43D|nr:hypothetical protein [Bradyrhizobium sp. 191]UPJ63705.1 hypothetical protein IVB23_27390 [Bradyrhizobium sp. 191]